MPVLWYWVTLRPLPPATPQTPPHRPAYRSCRGGHRYQRVIQASSGPIDSWAIAATAAGSIRRSALVDMTTQNGRAFNEWLRAQLKAKKMSQRQLAQQSGVDHSTISRLIRGDRMPSLGTATKLARGLRELRDDADTPQYLGLVASGSMNPTARVEYALRADDLLHRAAGPPDHGVLPRGPDAPLRAAVPADRPDRLDGASGRAPLGRPAGPSGRWGSTGRPVGVGVGTVRPVSRPSRREPGRY